MRATVLQRVLVVGATIGLLATAALTAVPAHAAFPGFNGKIFFKGPSDSIWSIYADGSHPKQLTVGVTDPSCEAGDEEPQVSPAGDKVVFTRTRSELQEIWTMNTDGSNQTRLTWSATAGCGGSTFNENPSWSPSGRKIIFTSKRTNAGTEDLWVMNANGSKQHKLFGSSSRQESEAFYSPDGSKIVFNVEPSGYGSAALWSMNSNGTGAVQLTTAASGVYDENASWSPNSQQIAFTSNRSGGDEVWVMNANGSGQTQLTNKNVDGGNGSEQPAFSPDGHQIAFASDRGIGDRLWTMNADGSNETTIPSSLDNVGQPDWGKFTF